MKLRLKMQEVLNRLARAGAESLPPGSAAALLGVRTRGLMEGGKRGTVGFGVITIMG